LRSAIKEFEICSLRLMMALKIGSFSLWQARQRRFDSFSKKYQNLAIQLVSRGVLSEQARKIARTFRIDMT